MRSFLLILLLLSCGRIHAQFTYVLDQSIPVKDAYDNTLTFPWAGGLNAAQYNTLDINGDNTPDIVLFDRMANNVITFINNNNSYQYSPQYEWLFPEITNWLLLRDFNCDGKKDIFTGDLLGIKVYENITQPGEMLQWSRVSFSIQPGKPKSQVIITEGFSGKINLQLQYDDLPSISDLDRDGDLDILNFQFGGGGTIEFHENISTTCDSMVFKRTTNLWGGLTECQCGQFAFNNELCPTPPGGRTKHAGGKFLLALDIDNDQDQDLLYSEASCTQLFLLENEGDSQNPIFTKLAEFPSSYPANFTIFPSSYYEDLDFDGIRDLVATPAIFNKEYNDTDLQHSNWFYKNTATDQSPEFTFIKNNFLQDQMIDVGDNAVPAFADADGDGDIDMFIGQDNAANSTSSIYYYQNTGTKNEPAFKFITDDYYDVAQSLPHSLINIKPQFADITGDNRLDLIATATNLVTAKTAIYYVENRSSSGLSFTPAPATTLSAISIQFSENIYVTDINLDGLADVLVGRNTGAVEYWKNTGPVGSLNFVRENSSFLGIGPSLLRQSPALTSADLDADGKTDLIVGDQRGLLSIISNYRETDVNNSVEDIVFNPLANTYIPASLGGRIWPAAANLFNSNKPAIIVGNTLGGLRLLRHDEGQSLPDEISLEIYPNPVGKTEILNIKADRPASVQWITATGEELGRPFIIQPNQAYPVAVSHLSAGIYLLRFTFSGKSRTQRVVIW